MRVGVLQHNPTVGNFEGNITLLEESMEQAAERGAVACVAPAFALTGKGTMDMFRSVQFLKDADTALSTLATRLHTKKLPPLLLGGLTLNPLTQEAVTVAALLQQGQHTPVPLNRVFASALCLEPGICAPQVRGGVCTLSEKSYVVFMADELFTVLNGERRAAANALEQICANVSALDVSGIFILGALDYWTGGPLRYAGLSVALARRTQLPVAHVNMVGGNDGLICFGASALYASNGDVTQQAPLFQEKVLVTSMNSQAEKKEHDPAGLAMPMEQEIWQALTLGIKDFVQKSGFSKVVVALSGGIDSALVVTLAVDALGPENVSCLLLPSPYSSVSSIEDSNSLAANLGITTLTLPINDVFSAFLSLGEEGFPPLFQGVSEENIQARIRGDLMMAYAQAQNALVLTTGNKSELGVGYCTLYGDMCGALSVIGDVYKTEVYALCRWRNSLGKEVLPQAILDKAPSAELREGQRDTDSLPPYETLDAVLKLFIEERKGVDEAVALGFERQTVVKVHTLFKRAEFKRKQAPPVLQISNRSFGHGWQVPVVKA